MRGMLSTLDRLLRGDLTRREELQQGRFVVPIRLLVLLGLSLGAVYGLFMGLYGVLRPTPSVWQLLATTAKVPLLFLLTLVVTFPSLYVFSTLAGSSLRFAQTLRLLLAGIVIDLALLASFGPVTGFFTLSTESYPFMIVLNVLFFGVGGIAGLVFMARALDAVTAPSWPSEDAWEVIDEPGSVAPPSAAAAGPRPPSSGQAPPSGQAPSATPPGSPTPRPRTPRAFEAATADRRARTIFYAWTVIYGAVGAQMGWILRPFIGTPDQPFQLFRDRESNFFEAIIATLEKLFGA